MKVQVFISESRISKKKYVEDFKPRERLDYLSKYPKSSFKKFTDPKGKIVAEGKQPAKPKRKLSGKPKAPKNATTPKRGRNPVTKKFTNELLADATPRQANSIKKAVSAINEGRATQRTLNTLKRNTPEEMHDQIDAAFNKSKAKAKSNVEARRKEISEKPARKKAPAKKPVAKKAPAKKPAAKKTEPKQEPVEKPSTQDAAKVVQQVPKAQRGSFMESMKRVFNKKATDKDVEKLEKAKKGMDKTSRETLDKLKRYAEEGIIGKKKAEGKSTAKPKSRKKLTKRQLYDRVRDIDLPKITKYRERQTQLKDEFKEKANAIANGKGTKEQRMKKYKKLRETYTARLQRNAKLANNLIKKSRERIKQIREETDREDG